MALYDGVLVAKIGRLTRKRDWDIRQWAEDHGKKILVVSPELEWPPNPGDVATPIIWDDLVNLAAGEWENTSQRYRRMQKELREQQYFVGQAPYGTTVRILRSVANRNALCHAGHPNRLRATAAESRGE